MKLNKNYQSCSIPSSLKDKKSDFFFPLFLPTFQKTSGSGVANILSQSLERFWKGEQQGIGFVPLLFQGVEHSDRTKILQKKTNLPFSAKLQRFSIFQKKNAKKQELIFPQIFSHYPYYKKTFSLTDSDTGNLLKYLQTKNIRKLTEQIVRRDVSSQTVVHPDAILWKKEKKYQLEVKCFVETKNDVFPLVVDDPMLLFSDVGVVVHMNDKRYKKHIGKKIIIPIINKSIPIFGEEGIDTVKNNGIQRLNPLFNPETLERIKTYNLPVHEEYIDDQGNFSEQVGLFGGKSVFDFTANIIETLATIGNLLTQQEFIQEIPYSKETGQRLIRKVISSVVIDIAEQKESFLSWLDSYLPEAQSLFSRDQDFQLQIENKNPYADKLTFLLDKENNLTLFSLLDYKENTPTLLSLFLFDQLRKGNIKSEFSLNELIDTVFLLPDSERLSLAEQIDGASEKEILTFKKQLQLKDSDILIQEFYDVLSQLPRIQTKVKGIFQFNADCFENKVLINVSCDDMFLQILALLSFSAGKIVFSPSMVSSCFLRGLLMLIFLTEKEDQISFFPSKQNRGLAIPFPEKFTKLTERYGRDPLRLLIAQQKYEESLLDENFDYLKHLWNLFKTFYEAGVFDLDISIESSLTGKEFRIVSQWLELQEAFVQIPFFDSAFPQLLESLQHFTREKFSWYLVLLKQEKNQTGLQVGARIFLAILKILSPIVPDFSALVQNIINQQELQLLNKETVVGKKDYKVQLFFDILEGIFHKKSDLQIKKHLPIEVAIQANADILHVVESYEGSLNLIFKVQKIHYLSANEGFPSGFETFSILDITVGIKPSIVSKQEDALMLREKDLKAKLQTMEYLRSTLMAFSLNPLADPVKLEEKEQQLEQLKSDIQELELNIQKAKMQKKS